MKTICIMCPVGCELEIVKKGKELTVTGNACPRGESYGKDEMSNPKRIVTSVIKTSSGYASVKTDRPIGKEKIDQVLEHLRSIPEKTYQIGDIVASNIVSDENIVVTGTYS